MFTLSSVLLRRSEGSAILPSGNFFSLFRNFRNAARRSGTLWLLLVLGTVPLFAAQQHFDTAPGRPTPRTAADEIRLAGDFLAGRGVTKDLSQAAYWYRKAADQGDPEAQNQLGFMYFWGVGLSQDPKEAGRWFLRATAGGSQQAKLNLAVMYMNGTGLPRDVALGANLLFQLAEKGNARAQDYLGILYMNGVGVERNQQVAEKWLMKAAKNKNPEGEYAVGTLYAFTPNHEHDYRKAARFLRRSVSSGYVPAMHALGVLLLEHPEVGMDNQQEPLEMLNRAAGAGVWRASATLAILARDGREMRQDAAEAYRWFVIAARQGGDHAREYLEGEMMKCQDLLPAEQQESLQQQAELWLASHPHANVFVFDQKPGARFPIQEIQAMEPGVID